MFRKKHLTKREWAVIEFVLKHGKPYAPQELPAELKKYATRKLGTCYDTSLRAAVLTGKDYVEGFVLVPETQEIIPHGWIGEKHKAFELVFHGVDKQGKITRQLPFIYYGIAVQPKKALDFFVGTEYQGILMNAWRDPELAKQAIPALKNAPELLKAPTLYRILRPFMWIKLWISGKINKK